MISNMSPQDNMNPNSTMVARVYPEQSNQPSISAAAQCSESISIEMAEGSGTGSSPRRVDENSAAPILGLSNSAKQMEGGGNRKLYVKQVTGRHNDTDLHLAVKEGELEAVKALLNACDDAASLVNEVNELGETPLYVAAERGDLEVLKELLRFAHPDTLVKKSHSGYDAFHIAAKQGHVGVVKELLKHKSSLCMTCDLSNATPLISAASKGHTEVVQELLSADRQLMDISKSNGKNALHLAARAGYVDIVRALLDKDQQMARKQDKKGQTALHMAAKGATCLEVVKELLTVDPAIVMLPDRNGNTALHVATRKKRVEIVKELLLLRDINVNALNRTTKTALDLAEDLQSSEEASEIADALVNAGAVKAKNLNQPRDELKQTVSAIKHDVHHQLKQTRRTNKKVNGIAKELRKLHREGINNATNSVTVVAVLFATVAFAAIFTVPGGFVGDNNNQPSPGAPSPPSEDNGTAVVAHYFAFKIFFIFNAIALFTSIAVVVVQITLGASATAGLLSSVPPEIELSDYQALPNGDIESPLDLLKGERQKVGPISDLDRFFERLYKYYCEHGLRCIVIRWIGNNVSLGFTIVFSGICLLCVDWHGLITLKCGGPGGDAVECDLAKVAFRKHPLKPFTLYTAVVVGYLGLFSLYWIFCFLIFFVQLKDTLEIRDFYQKSLNITDQELQRMSWSAVLEKTIQFQSIERLCVVKDLSAHDVVMRIMRKDNYLIGMLNKGVLGLPIPQWVPGAGPVVHWEANGTENRLILTKTLEWSLKWCILQYMFDRNFFIRRDFINNPGSLRKRLMIVGFLMLVLCPFLVIFMLVYLFLMHAEQFYNHPSTALSRRWSNLAKWLFREFNELEHLFKSRLSGGIEHANDYVRQFPSPVVSLIAKHVSFVAGGLEAILIFIAILEESLLEGQLFGRNLLWYTAVLGAIIAISKSLITEDFQEFDHEGTMALVAQHSHHMPKSWRGAENSEYVRREFEALFQYTGVMLFEDMASLFVTPYILIFLLPKQVDAILQFIQDFTVNIEGVGDVCSLSVFDFELHGNSKYGSPCNTSKDRRSGQGKMEKSFLSFKSSYPSWEPNAQGKQFLYTLMDFRQQEQDRQATQMYSPDRISQRMPSIRGLGSGYSSGLRERVPHRSPLPRPRSAELQTGQLDQPWTSDMEQKDHLYWLDRYYTLQSLYASDVRDNQDCMDALQHNFLAPYTSGGQQLMGQRESHGFFMDDRKGNHMEASTSSAIFQDSVFRQGTVGQAGHMGESTRWWARKGSQSIRGYESFREPPLFSGGQLEGTIDELSYGSDKEQGMVSGMKQSSAAYTSDLMKESSASYRSDFIDKNINALHFPYNNEGRDTIWAMKESSDTYANDFTDENSGLLFCDMPGRPVNTSQERMRPDNKEDKEE